MSPIFPASRTRALRQLIQDSRSPDQGLVVYHYRCIAINSKIDERNVDVTDEVEEEVRLNINIDRIEFTARSTILPRWYPASHWALQLVEELCEGELWPMLIAEV